MTIGNYIFPKKVANSMAKISQRTQYEASMMSMVFILLGLKFITIYMLFMDFGIWFKVGMVVNGVAGIVFIGSYLVTTFQQYQTYMIAMGFMESG
jgi:hypothetical protein